MAKKKESADEFFHFPAEALKFLSGLSRNNNKQWYEAHKADYQKHLLEPLKDMVAAIGPILARKVPGLRADPRVNGSIFRINRDTRFSKDKSPYKTHAAAFMWAGPGEKLACPGVYFHLDAKELLYGSGLYMFAPESLGFYRRFVAEKGGELARAVKKAEKAGFELGGEKLKKVPSGFPPDHEHAELLKMKGFHVMKTYPAKKVTEGDLIGWLVKEIEPSLDVIKTLEKAIF
ncbi:MAG: DUF2461 domain-containing protein [Nitrospinae bacterium]|nr:DUF2461 domain-containing protein [Nitrospinota bacterium]